MSPESASCSQLGAAADSEAISYCTDYRTAHRWRSQPRSMCDLRARVVAVVRADDVELATLLARAGCEIIRCTEADAGMRHSLAKGVRATADASGGIVALADMPFITTSTQQAVTNGLRAGASLVATQYRGQRGHPVGFCYKWFPQLTAMTGDEGGKTILENHRNKLELCSVDDPGVINDIDRPGGFVDFIVVIVGTAICSSTYRLDSMPAMGRNVHHQ